ncbi:hypothetical protein MRB53_004502 [Persea americana]|uniref:Uncharacterized protein n=1 Tax=Persea americana TaxID=3435 RepID=A0ACC2MAX1_PERAE|nr:hypothetical protein MRB53_004502 [Persea americana]
MTNKGRQRGLVSSRDLKPSRWISTHSGKIINGSDSHPMPRFCPKPSSKLSSFIRKDSLPMFVEGHNLPVSKSRDKAKETQKLRSSDSATNQRSTAWRIVNKGVGQNYNGVSATRLLSNLSGCYRDDMDDGINYGDHDAVKDIGEERWTAFADEKMMRSIGVEETMRISPIVEETVRISPSDDHDEDEDINEERSTFEDAKSIGVDEMVRIMPSDDHDADEDINEERSTFEDAKSIGVDEMVKIIPSDDHDADEDINEERSTFEDAESIGVDEMVRIIPSDDHDADEDINSNRSTFEDAESIGIEEMVRISPSEIQTDDDYDMDFDGVSSCGRGNEVEDEDWCLVGEK